MPGDIKIDSNGSEDMVRAQNNLDIQTLNGAIDIARKVATTDGDITIKSNHETYTAGQKGLTVEETGAINPGRNLNLNITNGDIEFKRVSAKNADIKTINGNVTADTIRADSVDVNDAVTVGKVLPYKSNSPIRTDTSRGTSSGGNSYSNVRSFLIPNSSFLIDNSGYSNFASNPSSFATLGTTFTNNGLTYWQSATSSAIPTYTFGEFTSLTDDISHRLTRNYFEVKFIPTWLEKEFLSIDFEYSFDNFGIKNATEDELTID